MEQLEELSRLDRKIKHLEKAETAAVEKIKLLTAENEELKASLEEVKCSLANSEDRLEGVKAELAVYVDKVSECSTVEAELRSSVKNLEAEKLRLEEVESERDVLQERLTQQQVLTKTTDPIGSKNTCIGLVPGSDLQPPVVPAVKPAQAGGGNPGGRDCGQADGGEGGAAGAGNTDT